MTMPLHKNPCSWGHKIYNFGRPFFGHHYYALTLSESCPRVQKKIFKEIMHFHFYMTYGHALAQEHLPRGLESYKVGKPFLGYHYYILTLFDLCLGIEKTISIEKMHSTLWLIWAHHGTRTPYPGVTKFTILVGPSLVIIIINFVSLSVLCIRVKTNIFKEKYQFYTFYPKITSPLGGGYMKFTMSCLPTLEMLHTKFG